MAIGQRAPGLLARVVVVAVAVVGRRLLLHQEELPKLVLLLVQLGLEILWNKRSRLIQKTLVVHTVLLIGNSSGKKLNPFSNEYFMLCYNLSVVKCFLFTIIEIKYTLTKMHSSKLGLNRDSHSNLYLFKPNLT